MESTTLHKLSFVSDFTRGAGAAGANATVQLFSWWNNVVGVNSISIAGTGAEYTLLAQMYNLMKVVKFKIIITPYDVSNMAGNRTI